MALISFGRIDKNLIPILIGCIFCFLQRLTHQIEGSLLLKNSIMVYILISFSKLFTLIPFLILHFDKSKNEMRDNRGKLIYINKKEKITKGKIIFLFLSAIIIFIQSLFSVYANKIKTNSWVWNILITSVFYYLFLKMKLYKHHYLCIAIIILIGFIIDLILGNLQNELINNLTFLLLKYLREILYSFNDVLDKYIMEKKFCSIYEIALSNGIINFILLGIFSLLDYYSQIFHYS